MMSRSDSPQDLWKALETYRLQHGNNKILGMLEFYKYQIISDFMNRVTDQQLFGGETDES